MSSEAKVPVTAASAGVTAPVSTAAVGAVANSALDQDQDEVYYFYQSADGQQLFLHSINFRYCQRCHIVVRGFILLIVVWICSRCLLAEHGSVAALPAEISAPFIDSDDYVQDEVGLHECQSMLYLNMCMTSVVCCIGTYPDHAQEIQIPQPSPHHLQVPVVLCGHDAASISVHLRAIFV